MPPAARIFDMHVCPMFTGLVPHVGGPIIPPCALTVWTGFLPQARVTDKAICVGPLDMIVKGSMTVFVNNLQAARIGDLTVHGGVIVSGFPTVLIGDVPGGGGGADGGAPLNMAMAPPPSAADIGAAELATIADQVNPEAGTNNCGFIIDAVYARLTGNDPNAVAPAPVDENGNETPDGSWDEIEQRFGTEFDDSASLDDAFTQVRDGGHGTMGLVKIVRPDDTAHVIFIANNNGAVGIVEGQGGGYVTSDADTANTRYNPNGDNETGVAILPDKFE